MVKKYFLGITGLLFAASLLFVVPAGAAEVELKLAVTTGDGHVYNNGCLYFKKRVEELSNNRILIHFYPSGQLSGNQRVLAEGIQLGTVHMTVPSAGALAGFDKRVLVFNVPYLFPDTASAYAAMDGKIGQEIAKAMERFDIKIVGWWGSGLYAITNSKRPINTVDDLKGLKIRCMENPASIALYKAWGATPTPMAYGEVFTALQQGTVDGQENSDANIYANKYHEVQKYMSMTHHFFLPAPMLMSKSKLEAMPKDLQEIFMQACADTQVFAREEYDRQSKSSIENMQKAGVIVNSPKLDSFKAIALTLYPEIFKMTGPEVEAWAKEIMAAQTK